MAGSSTHVKRMAVKWKGDKHDDYWRLSYATHDKYPTTFLRTILEKAGYEPKQDMSREALEELIQIKSYRFIGYSKLPKVQLLQYIAQRRIKVGGEPTNRDLVEALLEADKDRKFTKICDLPPELRLRICEFYVSDFNRNKGLCCPAQPPLARTNRLFRQDVLPLFYSNCRFHVDIDRALLTSNVPLLKEVATYRLRAKFVVFCSRIPSEYMKYIRFLRVRFSVGGIGYVATRTYDADINTNRLLRAGLDVLSERGSNVLIEGSGMYKMNGRWCNGSKMLYDIRDLPQAIADAGM